MEKPTPHEPMSADETGRVDGLAPEEIESIDDALAMHVTERHRKAAMIIGMAMAEDIVPEGVSELYYFERLKRFVDEGLMELVGYSANMRFCELRLKRIPSSDIE